MGGGWAGNLLDWLKNCRGSRTEREELGGEDVELIWWLMCGVCVQVRSAFAKIIVILAHVCNQDGPCPPPLLQGLYGQCCPWMLHVLLLTGSPHCLKVFGSWGEAICLFHSKPWKSSKNEHLNCSLGKFVNLSTPVVMKSQYFHGFGQSDCW